jgi:glycosyltransferase involved in cell wall biosynthesis
LAIGGRGGDLERVLDESGVPFRIVQPHDVAAIAEALAELASDATGSQIRRSANPHHYSREAIAGRLAVVLDRVATQHAGR